MDENRVSAISLRRGWQCLPPCSCLVAFCCCGVARRHRRDPEQMPGRDAIHPLKIMCLSVALFSFAKAAATAQTIDQFRNNWIDSVKSNCVAISLVRGI
jgi:hypothetical protein